MPAFQLLLARGPAVSKPRRPVTAASTVRPRLQYTPCGSSARPAGPARLAGQAEGEVREQHGQRCGHAVPRQVLPDAVLRAQAVRHVALDGALPWSGRLAGLACGGFSLARGICAGPGRRNPCGPCRSCAAVGRRLGAPCVLCTRLLPALLWRRRWGRVSGKAPLVLRWSLPADS